jgi:hypothetical protein
MAKISAFDDFEIPDEGPYTATVTRFIDLGIQTTKFGETRMASICFELADTKQRNGNPMLAFMPIFNFSARSKKFREFVRTLTGLHDIRDVDTRGLVGMPCMVDITHTVTEDGNTFANVAVRRPKPGAKKPKVKSALIHFSLHPSEFSEEDLETVPEGQRERIKNSRTYRELTLTPLPRASTVINDSLPPWDDPIPDNL